MTTVCVHGRRGRLGRQMLGECLRPLHTAPLYLWQIYPEIAYDRDPALAHAVLVRLHYPSDTVGRPRVPRAALFPRGEAYGAHQ